MADEVCNNMHMAEYEHVVLGELAVEKWTQLRTERSPTGGTSGQAS